MSIQRCMPFTRALITAAVAVPLVAVPTVAFAAVPARAATDSSSAAGATPAATAMSAPDRLSVVGGTGSITGTFGAASSQTGEATGYQVSVDGGVTWATTVTTATEADPTLRSFTVVGLTDGVRYAVRVRGVFGSDADADADTGPASGFASALVGTPATTPTVARIAGTNRVGTSVAVSQDLFPGASRARVAVVATSSNFVDSLAGARLASAVAGPLLLTDSATLPTAVAAELRRVVQHGGAIEVVGGSNAVSDGVLASLQELDQSYSVSRIAGGNRFGTAVAVATEIGAIDNTVTPIYLASGTNFPDGLAAAPAATENHGVLLLTNGPQMPAETDAYLRAYDPHVLNTIPVGGPAAAADPAAAKSAIVGTNRYETARLVAEQMESAAAQPNGTPISSVGLATGTNWPDALTGAAAMGITGGPLLLTAPTALDANAAVVVDDLNQTGDLQQGRAFGGPMALSDATVAQFTARVTR